MLIQHNSHDSISDEKALEILLNLVSKVTTLDERVTNLQQDIKDLTNRVEVTEQTATNAKQLSTTLTARNHRISNFNNIMITSFVLPVLVYLATKLWDDIRPFIMHLFH